jgi:hypothetical protein
MCQKLESNTSLYSLFSSRVVPDVLAEVEAGDREHKRVFAGLKQVDENLEHLVVGLIQLERVLAPKLF